MESLPFKLTLSAVVLVIVMVCGKSSGDKSNNSSPREEERTEEVRIPTDGSNIEGHYQAKFITLNPHLNGTIPGSANFFRKEERIYAYVRLFAGGVRAWHMQNVYTGGRCPGKKDDLNQDGFIDIVEAEKVLGKILIPLDSDIGSQTSGRRFFPLADLSGYYHYERITSFSRFFSDLQSEDPDTTDDIVKLPPNKGLYIVGKTFLVQGVIETIDFPETVASKGKHKPFQTLPVACGVFEKVQKAPGSPYVQDEIPGPVAEVGEGQDRPAGETPTTPGGGTTGGTDTNESDDGNGPVSDGEGRTRTDDPDTTNPPDTGDYGDDEDDEDETGTPTEEGPTTGGTTTDTSTTTTTTTTSSSDASSTSGGETPEETSF